VHPRTRGNLTLVKALAGAGVVAAAVTIGALAAPSARGPGPRVAHLGRVGAPLLAHAGPALSAADESRLLRRGPPRASNESPELPGDQEIGGVQGTATAFHATRRVERRTAGSPLPVMSWRATTGTGTPAPSAVSQNPPDPQIAVSSTHVVVGVGDRLFFYLKDGTPYPSGNNHVLTTTDLFQPLIDKTSPNGARLGLPQNGLINNFNDLRVIFDPYRRRFWVTATGTCRGKVDTDKDGKGDTTCAFALPEKATNCPPGIGAAAPWTVPCGHRRMVVGLAVSVDEDPTHGWYRYWWDAAVGWADGSAPYLAGDLGDYPSLGINATTVDVSLMVVGTKGKKRSGRVYPHIALYRAGDMAKGKGPTIAGWHLYPKGFKPDPLNPKKLYCSEFRDPDDTCPSAVVQPTLAHPDPGGSYLVARHPWEPTALLVWKVTDLLQPTQKVDVALVKVGAWSDSAIPSPQKGGAAANTIDMAGAVPIKAVWRLFLYVAMPDPDSAGQARSRVVRLWVSSFPNIPSTSPPSGGSREIEIGGPGSTNFYSWPAMEVNKNNDSVVVYSVSGKNAYASARYNAWLYPKTSMLVGQYLKKGEATLKQNKDASGNPTKSRWGDLAGASVDFVNGKEADGIWIVHEYARSAGSGATSGAYALWVGKIFGKTYPDYYWADTLKVSVSKVTAGGALKASATLANGNRSRCFASIRNARYT